MDDKLLTRSIRAEDSNVVLWLKMERERNGKVGMTAIIIAVGLSVPGTLLVVRWSKDELHFGVHFFVHNSNLLNPSGPRYETHY